MCDLISKISDLAPEIKISVISAIVAVFSALFSMSQAHSAKKSRKLTEQIYREGKPNFSIVDITDSFMENNECSDKVIYHFYCLIANRSDKDTSITNAKLQIDCTSTIFTFNPSSPSTDEISEIALPANIGAHKAVSGWLKFEVPRITLKKNYIKSHCLVMKDIHNFEDKKEVIYIRERINENEGK